VRISVALPSVLGRVEAAAFRGQLLVAFDQKESVVIDCAQASPLPALWVQLLCSAAASAQSRQLSVVLKGISDHCRSSFTGLGIDPAASALVLE
jgi:anti-anti-sigma regulatory factor